MRLTRGGLDQLLFNLAANARDAMAQGGTMEVRGTRYALGTEEATSLQLVPGPYVHLEVRDTGEGMTAETLHRAFDPFFSTKPVGAGNGLGLATVYSVVRQAKGHVSIQSVVGEGATFRILLPTMTTPHMPTPVVPMAAVPAPGPGGRVLLVDDDVAVRRVIATLLRRQGIEVQEAGSAEEALRWLRAAPSSVEMVISDVRMPGMNGFDLALEVRRCWPTLPVLLVSGFVDDTAVHRRIEAEGLPMVSKPFDVPAFLARVQDLLRTTG